MLFINKKKKHKKETLRAFLTHFESILYFTSSKSYFSILTTYFYKTPHISFSILQYIILKYYKIILFIYIYIYISHSNQTHGNHQNPKSRSTTTSTTRSIVQINNPAHPRSTIQINNPQEPPPQTAITTVHGPNPSPIAEQTLQKKKKEKKIKSNPNPNNLARN